MPLVIRRNELPAALGLKRTAIGDLIRNDPDFPRPIKLTPRGRAVGFVAEDIQKWLRRKQEATRCYQIAAKVLEAAE